MGLAALASLSMGALARWKRHRFRAAADALGLDADRASGQGVIRTGKRRDLEVSMSLLQRERLVTRRVQGGGPLVPKNLKALHRRREKRPVQEWWTRIRIALVMSPESLRMNSVGGLERAWVRVVGDQPEWALGNSALEAAYDFGAATTEAEEIGRVILRDEQVQRALMELVGGPFSLELDGRSLVLQRRGRFVSRAGLTRAVDQLLSVGLALDQATRDNEVKAGVFR